GLLPPPIYFPENVRLNKEGYDSVENIIENNKVFTPTEFKQAADEALILDVRDADSFGKAHIPGSIFIGIDGGFAPWVGSLITDINQPIILITPEGREEETITRLARVGYDNTLGFLKGGIQSWIDAGLETDSIQRITAPELETLMNNGEKSVIDVRKQGEYDAAHIENVPNLPLDFINDHIADFPTQQTTYLHCAGGYRSMIAASILKARGFHNMIDVIGGFGKIKETHLPIVTQACASSCDTK
ncbi:MAG TPA: rhodanese-like domain-containing protein, partial [Flavobacterium sp.]|nr:rhodanese-like domain-containing protein [Flavobacterium sp.]